MTTFSCVLFSHPYSMLLFRYFKIILKFIFSRPPADMWLLLLGTTRVLLWSITTELRRNLVPIQEDRYKLLVCYIRSFLRWVKGQLCDVLGPYPCTTGNWYNFWTAILHHRQQIWLLDHHLASQATDITFGPPSCSTDNRYNFWTTILHHRQQIWLLDRHLASQATDITFGPPSCITGNRYNFWTTILHHSQQI